MLVINHRTLIPLEYVCDRRGFFCICNQEASGRFAISGPEKWTRADWLRVGDAFSPAAMAAPTETEIADATKGFDALFSNDLHGAKGIFGFVVLPRELHVND